MKNISLVAIDLDGTLLTSYRSPAPRGAALLTRAARSGIRVVIATTRAPDFVGRLCCSLEIDDPMICTNGAQVWGSPEGPVWVHRAIPREIALEIALWADARGWELSTTVGSVTYWRQRPGQALGPVAPNVTVVPANADGVVGDPVRVLAHQPEAVASIRSLCQSRFPGRCRAETYYDPGGTVHSLGVFALGADKGTALAFVLDRLGVQKEQALAIGDNVTDLAMFSQVGVCVAMGNAVEEVKQQATAIAPGNDEEGVAWALETFIFGGG